MLWIIYDFYDNTQCQILVIIIKLLRGKQEMYKMNLQKNYHKTT